MVQIPLSGKDVDPRGAGWNTTDLLCRHQPPRHTFVLRSSPMTVPDHGPTHLCVGPRARVEWHLAPALCQSFNGIVTNDTKRHFPTVNQALGLRVEGRFVRRTRLF